MNRLAVLVLLLLPGPARAGASGVDKLEIAAFVCLVFYFAAAVVLMIAILCADRPADPAVAGPRETLRMMFWLLVSLVVGSLWVLPKVAGPHDLRAPQDVRSLWGCVVLYSPVVMAPLLLRLWLGWRSRPFSPGAFLFASSVLLAAGVPLLALFSEIGPSGGPAMLLVLPVWVATAVVVVRFWRRHRTASSSLTGSADTCCQKPV